ncbi:MAG TPA: hypothetical protein VLI39_03080 [Sedimentisphaerales bacterium]|nr:hypothetical protein [Sedimentisphaerales bacterium]
MGLQDIPKNYAVGGRDSMAKERQKLLQDIFEARYERGYRYLDRCGDAIAVLEEALPKISGGAVWMPDEMAPKGAKMKCPQHELTLVIDSARVGLDQNPADVPCPFADIADYAFQTVKSKFDISDVVRLGRRKLFIVPTDSVDDAEALSIKKAPATKWPKTKDESLAARSCDMTVALEDPTRTKGVRIVVSPIHRPEAPLSIDERLRRPPHHLSAGQREALLEQLKRRKQRESSPVAGLLIDVDYWVIRPDDPDIQQFVKSSEEEIAYVIESFMEST